MWEIQRSVNQVLGTVRRVAMYNPRCHTSYTYHQTSKKLNDGFQAAFMEPSYRQSVFARKVPPMIGERLFLCSKPILPRVELETHTQMISFLFNPCTTTRRPLIVAGLDTSGFLHTIRHISIVGHVQVCGIRSNDRCCVPCEASKALVS